MRKDFNPRSREGSDGGAWRDVYFHKDFNPRSREGSDDVRLIVLASSMNFNPRSREGSDSTPYDKEQDDLISIHAPAKGATTISVQNKETRIFQSTLPRRERQNTLKTKFQQVDFNPRSREGSDAEQLTLKIVNLINFNPRSREGSDIVKSMKVCATDIFQSTLPRRERQTYIRRR